MATNPNWPLMALQLGFNVGVNPTATAVWTDLTSRMWSLSCGRGRQYELDQNQAGQGGIVLADKDEALNPSNPQSPYWPNVKPYRQVMAQAMWPPVPVGAATNLLSGQTGTTIDTSFESYANGVSLSWILTSGSGVSPTVTTTNPQQGSKSLTYNVTAGAGTSGVGLTINCIPGQQYTSSLYLRQTAVNTSLIFINGGAGGISTAATGSYVRLTVTWTASQPTHQLWVASFTTTNSGTVNVDAIQHEVGASASTFSTTGPIIYGVHRGFVERWPKSWKHQGMYGYAQITTVDGYAALAARKLHTEVRNSFLAKKPLYYWTFAEPQGATTFADSSGNSGPTLSKFNSKFGPAPTFTAGAATNIAGDPGSTGLSCNTGLVTSNVPTSVAQIGMGGTVAATGLGGAAPPVAWSFAMWISHTTLLGGSPDQVALYIAPPAGSISNIFGELLGTTGNLRFTGVWPVGSGSVTVADIWADGRPHLFAGTVNVTASTGTVTFYVDGASVGTASAAAAASYTKAWTSSVIEVGGLVDPNTLAAASSLPGGVFAHSGLWNRALSGSEILDLYNAGLGYAAETSGARITRYLAGSYAGATSIDTGTSTMGVSNLADGATLLAATQSVATSENGNLWCDGSGTLQEAARSRRYLATSAKWVFGELELPYEGDIGYDSDVQQIFNDVTVTRSGGVVATASDTASQNDYGPRSYPRTININSDSETIDAANWLLATRKDPHQRIAGLAIKPSANPALWPVALGAEVGDRATVKRRTISGYTMSADYYIERIDHWQQPDSWVTSFQMSPVPAQPLLFGDATFGRFASDGAALHTSIASGDTTMTVDSTNPNGVAGTGFSAGDVPYPVTVDSEQVSVTTVANSAADAFGRTAVSTWSSADIGGAYTATGTASDYAVNTGLGKHTLTSTNVARETYLTAGALSGLTYGEDLWQVQVSAVATGAEIIGACAYRRVDASNMYRLEVAFQLGGTADVRIAKTVAGVRTVLATAVGAIQTYTAGTVINCRTEALGSALRIKAWTSATEPPGWTATATDTAFTTGSVGFLSIAATGNTNASPVVSYGGYTQINPQVLTITRPVDGTATSHTALAPVALAQPVVFAY